MNPKTITSVTNQLIKKTMLLHTAKGRLSEQQFIAQGLRTCATLCASNCALITLFCTEKTYQQALSFAQQQTIILVADHVMNKISSSSTPSGFVGVFIIPHHPTPIDLKAGLVLAEVSDPGNMGTLIRSATAFGITTIIIVGGVDPWNPKVIQASAGTIGSAHIIEMGWNELIAHQQRPPLAALVVRGGQDIATTSKHVLLVVGNEAHGISQAWQDDCPLKVTIPMPGNAESLNAAVAGSLALYLIARN